MSRSGAIADACILYLRARGHFVWRQNNHGWQTKSGAWINPKGKKGVPDICGVTKDGLGLFVEVKADKDRMRPDQLEFMKEVSARGAIYIIAHSVDDVVRACQTFANL